MTCKMCSNRDPRELENFADPPMCAFPNGGAFNSNNWNCKTANALRDICGEFYEDERSRLVMFRCHNDELDGGDQKYAIIDIDDRFDMPGVDADWHPICLWVTWYKRRGSTDQMWLMDRHGEPRRPTEADILHIIETVPAAK